MLISEPKRTTTTRDTNGITTKGFPSRNFVIFVVMGCRF